MGAGHLYLIFHNEDENILKKIYYSIDYSEKTLREILKSFEKEGWIEFQTNAQDKRFKKIVFTQKFMDKIHDWLTVYNTLFSG